MKFSKVIKIGLAVSVLALGACSSSDEAQIATALAQKNYKECQEKYYIASELVKVELTTDGKVASMAVGNQNLRPCAIAQVPESAMVASIKVIGSVANNALNVAASSVPYVAMSKIAVDGIKNAGGNTYNDGSFNSHSEANQANQQTTTTETVIGIKAGGDVDQSQQNQNNPTTNTDNNSVNDSNNGGDDNSSTTVKESVEAPETEETQGDS